MKDLSSKNTTGRFFFCAIFFLASGCGVQSEQDKSVQTLVSENSKLKTENELLKNKVEAIDIKLKACRNTVTENKGISDLKIELLQDRIIAYDKDLKAYEDLIKNSSSGEVKRSTRACKEEVYKQIILKKDSLIFDLIEQVSDLQLQLKLVENAN